MQSDILRDDCTQCASLCCFALDLDQSPMFAIDKPAGVACPNLSAKGTCNIHSHLKSNGFQGCINFTCHGAGQRVTQEVFAGKSWQNDPAVWLAMIDSFRDLRRVHELLLLLREASKLPLTSKQQADCATLMDSLTPVGKMSEQTLNSIVSSDIEKNVSGFMLSLRDVAMRATITL